MFASVIDYDGITDRILSGVAEVILLNFCVHNRGDKLSVQLAAELRKLAEGHGMTWDQERPNIVVSVGGDGTLLQAFHHFLERIDEVCFVGVHTGHLGFYADWKPEEIGELAKLMATVDLNEEQKRTVEYPLLEIKLESNHGPETYYSLNEVTLKGIETTLVAQLNINGELFEMFRGDGICISTPSGSTAYNKSLGGALVHPSIEAVQIAEIASINNRIFRTLGSSILLPKHHYCDIFPDDNRRILVSVDHLYKEYENLISIQAKVANKKVRFVRYRPFPFWHRVQDAFINDISNE